MANKAKEKRAQIARETLDIIENGYYKNKKGEVMDIKEDIIYSVNNSVLFSSEDGEEIVKRLEKEAIEQSKVTSNIEVTNETTLHAARRLIDSGEKDLLCLNFASAKNPGGGFLKGSQAQEESLARASALYPCISQMKKMYTINKKLKSALYTDHMIYSPRVPVFRDDNDELLDYPYYISFITAPAVNVGEVHKKETENIELIKPTMVNRIEKILAIAVFNKYENIVLGAYGCGVFKNKPEDVAGYFSQLILNDDKFKDKLKNTIYAILDNSREEKTIKVFKEKLF